MKILLYCDWFKEYTSSLSCSLVSLSKEVTIILRDNSPEFNLRRKDEQILHDTLLKNKVNFSLLNGKYSSLKSIFEIYKFYQKKKKEGYNCFHIQQTSDPRFILIALKMNTVLTLHEPKARKGVVQSNGFIRSIINRLIGRLYRMFSNKIIVHTESCLINLSNREKRKAVVIPHGVSLISDTKNIDNNTILFFGRATEYKGIDTLISAMNIVWKTKPEARLRILASPGDYLINGNLDSRIIASWDGYSNLQLENELLNAKIVCMPYISVTGSGVGAQAYGAGKTIVASDLDGLRELVSNNDYLFPPGDEFSLANSLILALKNENNKQAIDINKTWPKVGETHFKVYQSLLRI